MNRRLALTVAVAAWAACAVLAGLSVWFMTRPPTPLGPHGFGSAPGDVVAATAYLIGATVGARVAFARPRSPLGWLLLGAALGTLTGSAASEYYKYALDAGGAGAEIVAWIGAWSWDLGAGLAAGFVLLLFPDGRLPGRRWRPALVTVGLLVTANTALQALAPGPLAGEFALVENPVVRGDGSGAWWAGLHGGGWVPMAILAAISTSALVVRYRRADEVQRQQLKWLAYAGTWIAVTVPLRSAGLSGGGGSPWWVDALLVTAVLAVPISFGFALLRYRLYDIDRLVSRTVSYGLLSGLLAGLYLLAVFALQNLLRPVAGESELAVAGATLAVAAAFGPARRRVQAAVDARFDCARYDAVRIVDDFRARLRDEIDLDQLTAELVAAVERTVAPAGTSVWLQHERRGSAVAPRPPRQPAAAPAVADPVGTPDRDQSRRPASASSTSPSERPPPMTSPSAVSVDPRLSRGRR